MFHQHIIVAKGKPDELINDPEQLLINKALEIVSGKWRLSIILLLQRDTLRYGELKARMPAVSEKVLAAELKTLTTLGVLSRKVYAEVPPRVEYALTQEGLQALPVLIQLKDVGRIFLNTSYDR